jgi:hypothetical protein
MFKEVPVLKVPMAVGSRLSIVTELGLRRTVISNCYRISPAGRLEIEAVVPSVFEAFFPRVV